MGLTLQIPFEQILSIVPQLSPNEKAKLQEALNNEGISKIQSKSSLKELLLSGPVFSEEQIKTIEEERKSINAWRTND